MAAARTICWTYSTFNQSGRESSEDQNLAFDRIWFAQLLLQLRKFDPGTADGSLGPRTRDAIKEFQTIIGSSPTGELDEATLDRYVGKYEYPGIGTLTVRRDKSKLLAQMTGQPEFELFAKADDTFFWKVVAAEIKFIVSDGKVEKAIHKQAGATIEAKKVE